MKITAIFGKYLELLFKEYGGTLSWGVTGNFEFVEVFNNQKMRQNRFLSLAK
jgi:hypothetical protein